MDDLAQIAAAVERLRTDVRQLRRDLERLRVLATEGDQLLARGVQELSSAVTQGVHQLAAATERELGELGERIDKLEAR